MRPTVMTDRIAVASSRINAIRYDASTSTLGIIFNDGSVWNYSGVSEGQHRELMDAPSIGKAFEHVRKNHRGGNGLRADLRHSLQTGTVATLEHLPPQP